MRAATYIRESSREQAEGFSPDAQRRALAQYAEAHGLEIVDAFEDVESGTREDRQGFQAMLAAAETRQFDVILLFHTSRFARDAEVARRAKNRLRKLGVQVVALNLPSDLDPDSPAGHLMEGISELFDENYSKQLGWWVRAGLREKFRQGQFVGLAPMGYERNETGRLVLSKSASLVEQAFLDYAEGGVSISQLARRLAQAGLRTARGHPPSTSAVKFMLRNATYIGRIKFKGEEQLGDVEPLISTETFDLVQQRLRDRRRGESKPSRYRLYPFGGMLRCAACDTHWRGQTHKGVARYRCYGPGGRGCSGNVRSVREDVIAQQVAERVIAHISLDAATRAEVVTTLRQRQPHFGAERRKLEQQQDRLRDLYELGDLTRDEYLERRSVIRARLGTVPPMPLPIQAQEVVQELDGLAERWPQIAPVAQRSLLRLLLCDLIVDNGVITAIHPQPEAMAVVAHLGNRPSSPVQVIASAQKVSA